ncbi:MAG: flavodoxin family protein [Verrucomicrobia bacterium]|nr:MAG: flavodoxin family protein [Verrucomicrobiota bacterium]
MKTISIVYYSGAGHTAQMAEAVAQGARSVPDTRVHLLRIQGQDIVEGRFRNEELLKTLDASDAIIFGSPTYMGSVAGQFKCFADATAERWFGRAWAGKLAAGFTVSGGPSGDKLNTLVYLALLAAQHGMIWVGNDLIPYGDDQGRNRLSAYLGVMGQAMQEPPEEKPDAADKATGEYLGRRVAELAARLG